MSFEPSKMSGIKNEIVGTVKENVGWALGNKQMETEGKITREQGHMELDAARAQGNTASTSTSGGGGGEGLLERMRETGEEFIDNIKHMGEQLLEQVGYSTQGTHDYSAQMEDVFASIRKADWNLKHVQTKERTSPVIFDKGYKLKKFDRKPLFNEIKRKSWKLKHVETRESSPLQLDKGFKLRTNSARKNLMAEINRGQWKLKHVSKSNDRSAPRFERFGKVNIPAPLLKEISSKKDFGLKHVKTTDKSVPQVERGIKLNKLDRKPFLGEVKKGVNLKHVETCDKSGLNLPRGFHMTTPTKTH